MTDTEQGAVRRYYTASIFEHHRAGPYVEGPHYMVVLANDFDRLAARVMELEAALASAELFCDREHLVELIDVCEAYAIQYGGENDHAIHAALTRLLALEAARWVPWKAGDALPESFDDRQYRTMRLCQGLRFSQDMWPETFERLEVFAYWSVPLPAPYDEALAALGGDT